MTLRSALNENDNEVAMEFRREIVFHPGYDKRHPEPSKNYGIHGADMMWYLHGPKGVVQFVVYTNWMLPHVQEEFDRERPRGDFPYLFHKPQPADIGYHSHKPMYEGQTLLREDCELLGGPCYYDGSSLQAEDVFKILITEGSDAVWKHMEERYRDWFEKAD